MTVQPPPNSTRETPADRRRRIASQRARLLSGTRRAEASINEALLNYGDSEQDAHRRSANEEIERVFPGVTEDEQNPTGQYMPDPKYHLRGDVLNPMHAAYADTHEPMRRRLHHSPRETTDGTSNDPTLGGEVAPWTQEEEDSYINAERIAEDTRITGTGEWAESLSPDEIEEWSGHAPFEYEHEGWTSEEIENALDRGDPLPISDQGLWVSGVIPSRRSASYYEVPSPTQSDFGDEGRVQLFRGNVLPSVEFSQAAPHVVDERNVKQWAAAHRNEVRETGIENTEFKQRFNKLKEDVKNTIVPVSPKMVESERDKEASLRIITANTQKHIDNLEEIWANHSRPPAQVSGKSSGSRRRTRRTDGPRRRNIEGVAVSFVTQGDSHRGATTGRGNFTHYPDTSAVGSEGRLNVRGLHRYHRPDTTDRNVLYSYSTPIAWRQRNGSVIVPTQSYSNTTHRHQNAVHQALTNAGYHSPQHIANDMMMTAYQRDRHKQTAGSPVGFNHYRIDQGAHEFIPDREAATNIAREIADSHYETVKAKQRENAAASSRRPRNSRKPFTRRQQLRLENAGQLRLPFAGVMPDAEYEYRSERGTFERQETYAQRNARIMKYPISLGYSPQTRLNVDDREIDLG